MVPFAHATNPPLGYGAGRQLREYSARQSELDSAPAHLQRRCRGHRSAARSADLEPASTADCRTEPGSTLNIAGVDYPLSARARRAVRQRLRRRSRASRGELALQWAPNDTSEYTFEAFYQGYREEMFNNLHFTFADWWGRWAEPGIDDHDVPGHQHHQDARRRRSVRLQQRRLLRAESTDT